MRGRPTWLMDQGPLNRLGERRHRSLVAVGPTAFSRRSKSLGSISAATAVTKGSTHAVNQHRPPVRPPIRPPARLARILAAAAIATITVLAAGTPALAAKGGPGPKPPKPPASVTVTATATVTGSDVGLTAKVNRPASDLEATPACSLNEQPIDCVLSSSNKKNSTYAAQATGLDDGDYTFRVDVTVKGTGLAVGSASFTIDNAEEPPPPPVGGAAVCASLGGTYQASTFLSWACTYDTADGSGSPDQSLAAACTVMGSMTTTNNGDGTFTKAYTCPREPALAQEVCGAYGGSFAADESFPFWARSYFPGEGSAALVDTLTAACTAMGWSHNVSSAGDGRTQFFCTTG